MEGRRSGATFGALLREHRLKAGLSQERLAERARVSAKAVGAIEQGLRRAPYRHTIELLATALELSPSERDALEHSADGARGRTVRRSVPAPVETATSLPTPLTPFIERREVNEIATLVQRHRLVTITGSGGVGKTRTAIEVSLRYSEHSSLPIWFVDLSTVQDPIFIADEIAAVFDEALPNAETSPDALRRLIGTRSLLLLLDNCEHLVKDIAVIVAGLLRACPNLSILVTSRELLGLSNEVVYRLPSLHVPERRVATMAEAQAFSAIALFVQRAQFADAQLSFGNEHISDVVDICRKLNGIPLAIELAAARLPSVGLKTLSSRLAQTLSIEGGPDLPARQRTIEATISWSVALLGDEERLLLERLGVFAGAFNIEAAEHVCADASLPVGRIPSLLMRLVEKSLLNVVSTGPNVRYVLLESIRAFIRMRLDEHAESIAAFRRHAEWLAELGDYLNTNPIGVPFDRPDDLDNARAAIEWCMESESQADVVLAARIIGGMRRVWSNRGLRKELTKHIAAVMERLEEREEHHALIARLWRARVMATQQRIDRDFVDQAKPALERAGDFDGSATLHAELALYHAKLGQFSLANEALAVAARHFGSGHKSKEQQVFLTFATIAIWIHCAQGDVAQARAALGDLQRNLKRQGVDPMAWANVLVVSAEMEAASGNHASAVDNCCDALEILHTNAPRSIQTRSACASLGFYLLAIGEVITSERLGRIALQNALFGGAGVDVFSETRAIRYLAGALAVNGSVRPAGIALGYLDAFDRTNGIMQLPSTDAQCYAILTQSLSEKLSAGERERYGAEGASLDFEDVANILLSGSEESADGWSIERILAEHRGQVD